LKFKKIALGGTFDILHKGHKTLLEKAFEMGEFVIIGLTTDIFANKLKGRKITPYVLRKEKITNFIKKRFPNRKFKIVPLNDPYGPLLSDPDIDALIVSEETRKVAEKARLERIKKGLSPFKIITLPLVIAKNGSKISSKAIREGLMDEEGRILSK